MEWVQSQGGPGGSRLPAEHQDTAPLASSPSFVSCKPGPPLGWSSCVLARSQVLDLSVSAGTYKAEVPEEHKTSGIFSTALPTRKVKVAPKEDTVFSFLFFFF